MHTSIRVLLVCILAVAALPGLILAAPSFQSSVDPRSLALTAGDIPAGFAAVPDRTVSEDRPDGVAVYDVTFIRERTTTNLVAGAYELRSGVARTARTEDAIQQFASTREAFAAEGWTVVPIPPLGDESAGLVQTTEGDGTATAGYSYLFRKGRWIMMVGLRGQPDSIAMDDAVALAIVVSQRVDRALGGGQPEDGTLAAPSTARAPLAERVRVINVGGANVRAEPSTSAPIITEAPEGLVLEAAGPNRDAEGRTWRAVRLSDGQTGWIAATLVESITPPTPATSPTPRAGTSPSTAAQPSATPTTPGTGVTGADVATPDEPGAEGEAVTPEEGEATAARDGSAGPVPAGVVAGPVPAGVAAPAAAGVATPAATPAVPANTVRATGPGGLAVEATLREMNLASGNQQVRVLVTRDGHPEPDARVAVTTRLDPSHHQAITAPRTGTDGRSEIEWPMEGPPGDYEVIVEVSPNDSAPPTTAASKFRWQ